MNRYRFNLNAKINLFHPLSVTKKKKKKGDTFSFEYLCIWWNYVGHSSVFSYSLFFDVTVEKGKYIFTPRGYLLIESSKMKISYVLLFYLLIPSFYTFFLYLFQRSCYFFFLLVFLYIIDIRVLRTFFSLYHIKRSRWNPQVDDKSPEYFWSI